MTTYNFKGKKFTDDDVADHFYDEDWNWYAKTLGFKPKNQADAEARFEDWKEQFVEKKMLYAVTTREQGSEHFPIKTGFKTEKEARDWAKKEFGNLRTVRIIQANTRMSGHYAGDVEHG
jgi:hypothetical protein